MISFFDNNLNFIGNVSNPIEGIIHDTLPLLYTTSITVRDNNYDTVKKSSYVGLRDDMNRYQLFKIKTADLDNDIIYIEGVSKFLDDMEAYTVIKDRRFIDKTPAGIIPAILENTPWTLGTVASTSGLATMNFYYISPLEAIKKVLAAWPLEVETEVTIVNNVITQQRVNFIQRGQQTDKRYEYGINALKILYKEDRTNIVTALIGRGKGEEVLGPDGKPTGGYTRRVGFTELTGYGKPVGQEYLEIPEATSLYGYAGGTVPRIGTIVFDDTDDPQLIMDKTWIALQTMSRPLIAYEGEVRTLEKHRTGDRVVLVRPDIKLAYQSRVISRDIDILDPANTKLVMGDPRIPKSVLDKRELQAQIDNLERKTIVNEGFYEVLANANTDVMFSGESYNYSLEDGNEYGLPAGFYSFNALITENPTQLLMLRGGMLGLSYRPSGAGTWTIDVFGTGRGFNANEIVAGILTGGKVNFNLESGTLTIGDPGNYAFNWDGTNLKIKGDNIDLTSNEAIQARVTRQQLISDPEIKNSITQAVTPAVVTSVRQSQDYQNDLAEAASSRDLRLVKNLIDGLTVTHNKLLIQINEIGETPEITTAKNNLVSQLASINTIYSSILADNQVTDEEWTSLDAAIASYGTTSATLEKLIVQALYKEIGTLAQTTNESFQQLTPEYLWEKVSGTQTWTDAMSQKADLDSVGKTVDEKIVAYDNSTISNMKSTIQTIREKVIEDGELILDKTKNFTYDVNNGLTIDGGGASALRLSDEMISFLMNGVTGDYWKNGWFFTKNVEVLESLRLPTHTLVKIGTGLAFRPTGR